MAQIVEVNGENVEFPDDYTDDQISAVIQGQAAPKGAAPTLTQEQQDQMLPVGKPTDMGLMPNGAPLPYGITPEMMAAANKGNAQSNQKNTAMRADPGLLEKLAAADKQGWLEGIGKGAMNTIGEFGNGIEDLADKYLPESVSNVLNYRPFGENGMTADQRMERRKGEMDVSNEDQLVRSIANPVATTVGSMLPYFGTGAAGELGINAVTKAISPITKKLVQNTLTQVGRMEGSGVGIANSIGESATTMAKRMDSAPKIPSDFQRRLAYGAKAPIIGAGEGSANYNQTAGEGALYSLAGTGMAAVGPLRMLDKVENVRDPYTKRLVKDMDREGFSLTPGVRTGNRQMQTEEAGMKNSDVLGDYFHQSVTRPNQRKMTELAGDAIGLDMRGRDNFSPEQLQGHLDNLSAGYKQLEANTTGKFTPAHMREAADILNDLKPTATANRGPNGQARYDTVKSITDQIRSESLASGINARQFNGAKYQEWRQIIQDETTQAYQSGDRRLGDALGRLRKNLDSSLEAGMNRGTAKEWKDLNERYAMTNMLARDGLTETGAVNPLKITSAVMNNDEAIRTLTNKGGRIKNFQKIAKYNDILSNVEGGSLTGLGAADMSASRDLGKLPFRYKLPLYARSAGAYRLSRAPTMGLGPLASLKTGRAFAQTEPADKAYEGAKMGVNGLIDYLTGSKE